MENQEVKLEKKNGKREREYFALLGLVELYIETGKPVGSNTLKENGFEDLSSATIRNYFANLEKKGLLTQQHASGGRIPTDEAYRLYAEESYDSSNFSFEMPSFEESKEIASVLQDAAEKLSHYANCPVFMSAPRFDHDYITDIKLVFLDVNRCLCVLITDFGVIQTEIFHLEQKLTTFFLKRLESYFHWRLTGHDEPENLTAEEEKIAQTLYNELMLRYIVSYSNFSYEEIYQTGFSKLLSYPDYQDTTLLANTLSLFEDAKSLRLLLRETMKKNTLRYWISEDLNPDCAVIIMPYAINNQPVGSIGIMGPKRLPYAKLFPMIRLFSEQISQMLTKTIYKFKISFREPHEGTLFLQKEEQKWLGQSRLMLLDDKIKE